MKCKCIVAGIFVLCCGLSLPAQDKSQTQRQLDRLAGTIWTDSQGDALRELVDRFGGRVTGSPAYDASANWALEQFKSAGFANAHLEYFTIPNGWQRGWARGQMKSPIQRDLHVQSAGWAPSTMAGGVRGDVLIVRDISSESIHSLAPKLREHIVLLDTKHALASSYQSLYADFVASFQRFKNAGALAVLLTDSVPNNVLGDWLDTDNGKAAMLPMPILEIGMEDAKLIARLAEQGPVNLAVEVENHITGITRVENVVAELRGSEKPDEWLALGAHLDSWDLGTGAQDNGSGVSMVLETAKAMTQLKEPPRRSIRFMLWAGEEPGLLGSKAFIEAHRKELEKCLAYLNTDNGVGHPRGWKLETREDTRSAMESLGREVLSQYSGGELMHEVDFESDYGPFVLQGIPTFDLWVDESHYEEIHHKSSDTFDKMDILNLKADTVLFAVTAYVMANSAKPIAAHFSHEEIAKILEDAGYESYLTTRGDWKP